MTWIADKLRAEQGGDERAEHDAGLAERIAARLHADLEASRQPAAPRPPPAPVPDWLFGPRHRELDAARRAAAEAARRTVVTPEGMVIRLADGVGLADGVEPADVLSPAPPVECCRSCGRPLIGAGG